MSGFIVFLLSVFFYDAVVMLLYKCLEAYENLRSSTLGAFLLKAMKVSTIGIHTSMISRIRSACHEFFLFLV